MQEKLQWQKANGFAIRRQLLWMYVRSISKLIRILPIAATNIVTDAMTLCAAVRFCPTSSPWFVQAFITERGPLRMKPVAPPVESGGCGGALPPREIPAEKKLFGSHMADDYMDAARNLYQT